MHVCLCKQIRAALPKIREAAGIPKAQMSQFESSVTRMLQDSVLDSVVHEMELKAGGLFLYASLVSKQLQVAAADDLLAISSLLQQLPNGLSEVYESNFGRMGEWQKHKRVIALIAVAREPLPVSLAAQVCIYECAHTHT